MKGGGRERFKEDERIKGGRKDAGHTGRKDSGRREVWRVGKKYVNGDTIRVWLNLKYIRRGFRDEGSTKGVGKYE